MHDAARYPRDATSVITICVRNKVYGRAVGTARSREHTTSNVLIRKGVIVEGFKRNAALPSRLARVVVVRGQRVVIDRIRVGTPKYSVNTVVGIHGRSGVEVAGRKVRTTESALSTTPIVHIGVSIII